MRLNLYKVEIEKGVHIDPSTIVKIFKDKRFDIVNLLTANQLDFKTEHYSATDMLIDDELVDKETIECLVKKGRIVPRHVLNLIYYRRFDLAQILFDEKKVKPNALSLAGLLLSSKNKDKIEFLIKNKVDVNSCKGLSSESPLYQAFVNDNFEIAQLLIDHGANLQLCCQDDSPMRAVIETNHFEGFKLLMEARFKQHGNELGLSMPIDDSCDLPPVFHVVLSGNIPMLQFLITKGAKLNTIEVFGEERNSLLHAAIECTASNENSNIVEYLIKNGANKSIKNKAGHTPLEEVKLLESAKQRMKFLNLFF